MVLGLLPYMQATAQWQKMQPDSTLFGNFYSYIHFVSDSAGFLVGCTGKSSWDGIGLFKTKNAGTSWSYIQGAGGSDDCLIPNSFVNENSGYCILSHGTFQPNDLMKTTTGGVAWNNLIPASGLNLGSQSLNGALYFVNDMLGFVAKDDTIYRTINNGASWQQVSSNHFIKAFFFTTAQTGYAAGDNIILKTTDGGENWQVVETNYSILSLSFPSANVGYAAGGHGTIIKTVDAGNTWSPQLSGLPNSISLNSIEAINDNTCYVVGDNGTILNTSNGGNSWIKQNSGLTAKLNSISCTKEHCYAVGDTSVILRTDVLGIGTKDNTTNIISVFPNPFSKEARIKINSASVTRVVITNAVGQQFEMRHSMSGQEITVSRGNLPAGIYFIRLMYGANAILSGKVVITD